MSEWIDIGEQLRKARENKGLELKDVSHTTRIPLATLSALEESDYSIFPSPTYARSFLSQYSEYLDVDAHDWIDAFETGDVLSNINDHGYLQSSHEHIGDHRHNSKPARRRGRAASHRDESSETSSGTGTSILQTLTVFLVTALLIGGGIYAYKKYEPMLTGTATEEKEDASTDGEKTSDTSTDPANGEEQTKPIKPPSLVKPKAIVVEEPKKPASAENQDGSTEPGTAATTDNTEKPEQPALIKPNRTSKPPKALVVEDE
ncbi:MAG: helix-turn-helix domain-containing protein [Verrucomicrobiae bacterium]|nr:helix-turn-helix domain-containing protein [Verrucomicrobiae bacterium]NNJ87370.1 helix-turn-helix domain-containing protein [Akkermansiaceae bacterium]